VRRNAVPENSRGEPADQGCQRRHFQEAPAEVPALVEVEKFVAVEAVLAVGGKMDRQLESDQGGEQEPFLPGEGAAGGHGWLVCFVKNTDYTVNQVP